MWGALKPRLTIELIGNCEGKVVGSLAKGSLAKWCATPLWESLSSILDYTLCAPLGTQEVPSLVQILFFFSSWEGGLEGLVSENIEEKSSR